MRLAAHLPRLLLLGAVFLFAGATLTYGAATQLSADTTVKPAGPVPTPTVTVPDVAGQAFVFAKGTLEDGGFAWRVVGSVHGFAADRVVSQSPAAGTKLKDTGAPTITVTLARTGYAETGEPEDLSPYVGTAIVPADAPAAAAPAATTPAAGTAAATMPAAATPATTKPATKKPAAPLKKPAAPKKTHHVVTKRPPAFVVAGAPKEPLDEMPLVNRARLLGTWLSAHPHPSNAAVRHFLYQNAWIVTGAKFGWWHGAEALRALIAVDEQAQRRWGIGQKSEVAARTALAEVEARTR
jgi:PASTA domain